MTNAPKTALAAFEEYIRNDPTFELVADHLLLKLESFDPENPEFRHREVDRTWRDFRAGWQAKGGEVRPLNVRINALADMLISQSWVELEKDSPEYWEFVSALGTNLWDQNVAAPQRDRPAPSPTQGMTLGQRLAHVGAGDRHDNHTVTFGSVMAVNAFCNHLLRDVVPGYSDTVAQERIRQLEVLLDRCKDQIGASINLMEDYDEAEEDSAIANELLADIEAAMQHHKAPKTLEEAPEEAQ